MSLWRHGMMTAILAMATGIAVSAQDMSGMSGNSKMI